MKLVKIKWLDSHAGQGWQSLDDIDETCKPLYCVSVGWLLKETSKMKVIVPHVYDENQGIISHGRGDLAIPVVSILEETVIEENVPVPEETEKPVNFEPTRNFDEPEIMPPNKTIKVKARITDVTYPDQPDEVPSDLEVQQIRERYGTEDSLFDAMPIRSSTMSIYREGRELGKLERV